MTYDAFIMSGVAEHYASKLHRLLDKPCTGPPLSMLKNVRQ